VLTRVAPDSPLEYPTTIGERRRGAIWPKSVTEMVTLPNRHATHTRQALRHLVVLIGPDGTVRKRWARVADAAKHPARVLETVGRGAA
jgi:peroxiredoxin